MTKIIYSAMAPQQYNIENAEDSLTKKESLSRLTFNLFEFTFFYYKKKTKFHILSIQTEQNFNANPCFHIYF